MCDKTTNESGQEKLHIGRQFDRTHRSDEGIPANGALG